MKNSRGFTLIEIMIVLVIVVTLSFLGTSLITSTFRSKARELTWRMTSTVKYLFNTAVTENKTIRLVFDFESNSYWAEGTSDKFLLESTEESEKRAERRNDNADTGEKDEDTGENASDMARAGMGVGGDRAVDGVENEEPAPALEPLEPSFGAIEAPLMGTREIPSGIYLKDVQTPHDKEPVSEGRAYIYFFQNGAAEAAIINFRDEADERQISIKIDPFTGSTDVAPEYRRLEEPVK